MTYSVNHVGITVSDVDRSLDFYVRILGGAALGSWERSGPSIDAVTGYPGVVVRQAFVRLARGATLIELLQYVGGSKEVTDPDHGRAGSVHVAVDVEGLDEILDRMQAEGVVVLSEPLVAGEGPLEGCRLVYVLDPDRVRVELVESPDSHEAQS